MQGIGLLHAGQVLLTAALDSRDNMSRTATPLTNLARPSSFRRSFTRSSSLSNATQLALLGPGDSFGDEVCGLPTVEEDSRCLVAAVLVLVAPSSLYCSAILKRILTKVKRGTQEQQCAACFFVMTSYRCTPSVSRFAVFLCVCWKISALARAVSSILGWSRRMRPAQCNSKAEE